MSADGRRGFVLDLEKCTGCSACALACTIENELPWGTSWRQVTTFNPERLPGIPTFHLSLACNHCEAAPCMRHCPTRAIGRDARTGNVVIDAGRCIGCKYCVWACPYGAPRFDAAARVMTKCTGCNHRVAEGLEPACVALCPTTALEYGALAGVESVPGFPETPARPGIRFQPWRDGNRAPECTWQLPATIMPALAPARTDAVEAREITLRAEWPLLVFTTVLPLLVGWTLARAIGAEAVAAPVAGIAPAAEFFLFIAGAALALGSSLMHLGHKSRAWRALANVRGSWLSREVAGASGFVLVAAASLLGLGSTWIHWVAAGLGIGTLFAMDRVYDLVRPRGGFRLHSADTLATGLLYAAAWRGWTPGVLILAVGKLLLYGAQAFRQRGSLRRDRRSRSLLLGLLRVLGLGAACGVAFVHGPAATLLFVAMVLGEICDRGQFYTQLEIVSPERQVQLALAERSGRTARTS